MRRRKKYEFRHLRKDRVSFTVSRHRLGERLKRHGQGLADSTESRTRRRNFVTDRVWLGGLDRPDQLTGLAPVVDSWSVGSISTACVPSLGRRRAHPCRKSVAAKKKKKKKVIVIRKKFPKKKSKRNFLRISLSNGLVSQFIVSSSTELCLFISSCSGLNSPSGA